MHRAIIRYAYRFTQLQLLIMWVAFPLTTWWGLPLSYMSILGNGLFTPLLTPLIGSGLILLFCGVVGLPIGPARWVFEMSAIPWGLLLSWSSPQWLIWIRPPWALTGIFSLITAFAHKTSPHPRLRAQLVLWGALGTLVSALGIAYFTQPPATLIIENESGVLACAYNRSANHLTLENNGFFSHRFTQRWLRNTVRRVLRIISRTYGGVPTLSLVDQRLSHKKMMVLTNVFKKNTVL